MTTDFRMMRGKKSQEDILLSLTKELDGDKWNETKVGWSIDGNLTGKKRRQQILLS